MQPDKAAVVRGWLSKAANDLRGAHIDLDADPPLIEDALFHCQQAAEKSLKAFLTSHDRPFKKT
jgi:HEPN domain-containing protein